MFENKSFVLIDRAHVANEKILRDREMQATREMAEGLLDEILHEAILDINQSGKERIEADREKTREMSRDILYSIIEKVPTGNFRI